MKTDAQGSKSFSQREIYDERYAVDAYDQRSNVRVLTAEKNALNGAVQRATLTGLDVSVMSVLDFGYGTGRVTNDFISAYPSPFPGLHRNLRVVAYDVSSVGLKKAADELCSDQEFAFSTEPEWRRDATHGYVVGTLRKQVEDLEIAVALVHGSEHDSPKAMAELLIQANNGAPFTITTSWYSGLGHIVGAKARSDSFAQLGSLTHTAGELVIALASTGDVAELQREWAERLQSGNISGYPIEGLGDVLYETELGQLNFWHVFGLDLHDNMQAISGERGQSWWVEAIRFPDDEFETRAAELENYAKVASFNTAKRRQPWTADDYRKCHTVAVFRSGSSAQSI